MHKMLVYESHFLTFLIISLIAFYITAAVKIVKKNLKIILMFYHVYARVDHDHNS